MSNHKYKLHILVPYRDRETHLKKLLPRLQSYLTRLYHVWVIEQDDDELFCRGQLFNAGFLELVKRGLINDQDDVVLHDVDNLPIMGAGANYGPVKQGTIRHMFGGKRNWACIGGVALLKASDFSKINGFSTRFHGYGKEDNDFYNRVKQSKLLIDRSTCSYRFENQNSPIRRSMPARRNAPGRRHLYRKRLHKPRFEELAHTRPSDKELSQNIPTLLETEKNPKLQQQEGLNTTEYIVNEFNPIDDKVTKILIKLKHG